MAGPDERADLQLHPPTLTASASIGANLTPTLDVLLYGAVGPQIALKAGLLLSADITKTPAPTADTRRYQAGRLLGRRGNAIWVRR